MGAPSRNVTPSLPAVTKLLQMEVRQMELKIFNEEQVKELLQDKKAS